MTFRLGLRLAVAGGRESLLRLAVTALGVGVGVTLLLLCLTGYSAAKGRADRFGWQSADSATPRAAPDPALFLSVTDYHDGEVMTRAYLAALGPHPPVPPGLSELPGPGEVAVSPAMARLLDATPDDELDDRYPGRIVATIGDAGLAHPDQLVALVGRTPDQLSEVDSPSLHVVRGFGAAPSIDAFFLALRMMILVSAGLLLLPVVVFIVMATRVAASHREQRLAAIRLVGATRLQAGVVAAVETGLAALAGSALGWVGYEAGRRVLAATVTFQGGRFFTDDVVVAGWVQLLVLVGVPVVAMLTTVAALGRVQAGPLAVDWGVRRAPPSAWRALPLGVGVGGLLAALPLRDLVGDETLDNLAPLSVLVTIVGFVVIGPWLCALAGRGLARVSRRVPGLLAARRIANDPRATFRVVSGVVLAASSITYSASLVDPSGIGRFDGGVGALRPGVVEVLTGDVPEAQVAPLLTERTVVTRFEFGTREVVESCAELARVVVLSCSSSSIPSNATGGITARAGTADADSPVSRLLVLTDGTPAAENRVRTQAANLVPNAIIHTQQDRRDVDAMFIASIGRLLRVFWEFVLVVAACSLTVGMVAGIIERRRPFALLRASGLRLGELRQVVLLETAAAMLLTAAVGTTFGLASSYALARFTDIPWHLPDPGVFAMVAAAILISLALSLLTLPLLDTTTRHDSIRYE